MPFTHTHTQMWRKKNAQAFALSSPFHLQLHARWWRCMHLNNIAILAAMCVCTLHVYVCTLRMMFTVVWLRLTMMLLARSSDGNVEQRQHKPALMHSASLCVCICISDRLFVYGATFVNVHYVHKVSGLYFSRNGRFRYCENTNIFKLADLLEVTMNKSERYVAQFNHECYSSNTI